MNYIVNFLNTLVNKFLRLKKQVWSHFSMLIGWNIILFTIIFTLLSEAISDILIALYFSIYFSVIIWGCPFIIIFLVEKIFYRKYCIKWIFILENPIYNFFWIIGQLAIIIPPIIFIILELGCHITYLSHKIMSWLLLYE